MKSLKFFLLLGILLCFVNANYAQSATHVVKKKKNSSEDCPRLQSIPDINGCFDLVVVTLNYNASLKTLTIKTGRAFNDLDQLFFSNSLISDQNGNTVSIGDLNISFTPTVIDVSNLGLQNGIHFFIYNSGISSNSFTFNYFE